ncbi:hypothetical protein SNEBB_007476 [Seison nebaliae]|nr:hypothetical protein SNEBB_007476 [Seison nebaliae]
MGLTNVALLSMNSKQLRPFLRDYYLINKFLKIDSSKNYCENSSKTIPFKHSSSTVNNHDDSAKKTRLIINLNENEVEEKFIKGSGPGGQSVNKTINCCQIRHIPTNIIVTCHQDRSLEKNRKLAREILLNKLDIHFNGEQSLFSQGKLEMQRRKREKKTKTNKKLEKIKQLKRKSHSSDE